MIVCVGALLHVQFTSKITSILCEGLSMIYQKKKKPRKLYTLSYAMYLNAM